MKQSIIEALKNSLVGNTLILQQSNSTLSQLSKSSGFCMCLMQIVDDQNFEVELKQSALIQLKNNIKEKWRPKIKQFQLSQTERDHIKNALVLAIIRCARNHRLIKLYRQILATVLKYQFQVWIPTQNILAQLIKGENLAAVFQCIVAICTNFQFAVFQTQKLVFANFLKEVLPVVLLCVRKHIQDAEVIYLSLKILWKTVHYEIAKEIKVMVNGWMELLLLTIEAFNEELQKKIDGGQQKNTEEFYYFHSKKWATRIVFRFIKKHTKIYQYDKLIQENVQYSKFWYENYGIKLYQAVLSHLFQNVGTIKKVRYFQLKIIQGIIEHRPDLIIQHSKQFQYDILLKYMYLTRQEDTYAKQDVVEYLRNEEGTGETFSNLKQVATQTWNTFMEHGSKQENKIYYPGPFFSENIEFIINKISSQNLLQKQLGMYMFFQNRTTIMKVPAVSQKLDEIIQKYVVQELASSVILMRVRANDLLSEYGKQLKNFNLVQKVMQGVFKCLTQDQNMLVKIKASIALNSVIEYPGSKELLKPYLKIILVTYLKIIEEYDLERVVSALECFIDNFCDCIGPFAVDLFRCLTQIFVKMFNKDLLMGEKDEGESQIQLAASKCMKAMTQIIQAPLSSQIRSQLQPCATTVFSFLFTNQTLDYSQQLMYMIKVYVQKVNEITPVFWFFYQVIIYFVAGIPPQLWQKIENMQMNVLQKKIFISLRNNTNFEMLYFVIPVLRNYFGKCQQVIQNQTQQFKISIGSLVFYLIGSIYKRFIDRFDDGQYQNIFQYSTILLVYFFQSFQLDVSKKFIFNGWGIFKLNSSKGQTIYLQRINCQLLCVMIWKHPFEILKIVFNQMTLGMLVGNIRDVGGRLEQPQERKRVILGICSYMITIDKNLQILGKDGVVLFQVLIKLLKKNYKSMIKFEQSKKKTNQIIDMKDDTTLQQKQFQSDDNNNFDDTDDFWDEEYNEYNLSILRKVNQFVIFKQCMQKICKDIPQMYTQIIKSVQKQKLVQIDQIMNKVLLLGSK